MATLATTALKLATQLSRVNADGTQITDLAVQIKDEIGEAIRYYNRTPWALTEVRGMTVETVASQAWYSAVNLTGGAGDQSLSGRSSADFNTVLTIDYARQGDEPLCRISYDRFETLSEGTASSGDPSQFTVYAGQLGLWPTPDSAYTVYLSGIVKAPIPTQDADTSIWLEDAEALIIAAAGKRVCLKYLRDADRAKEFDAIERMEADQLEREYIRKTSSGRVRINE